MFAGRTQPGRPHAAESRRLAACAGRLHRLDSRSTPPSRHLGVSRRPPAVPGPAAARPAGRGCPVPLRRRPRWRTVGRPAGPADGRDGVGRRDVRASAWRWALGREADVALWSHTPQLTCMLVFRAATTRWPVRVGFRGPEGYERDAGDGHGTPPAPSPIPGEGDGALAVRFFRRPPTPATLCARVSVLTPPRRGEGRVVAPTGWMSDRPEVAASGAAEFRPDPRSRSDEPCDH